MSAPALKSNAARIESMDQFRGYTMAGMFLVNFIGSYAAVHPVFKHHNNVSTKTGQGFAVWAEQFRVVNVDVIS